MVKKAEEEKALVQRLKAGDEVAFELIFELYKDRLYNFCLKFTKSPEWAEEIVQDVFVKVWINRNQIDTSLSFNAYLFKISKNLSLNFLKRAQLDLAIRRKLLLNIEETENFTEVSLLNEEYEHLLDEAIQRLPHQQQVVFKLSRIDGLTHSDIAKQLNLSKGTVKNYMMLAVTNVCRFLHISADKVILVFLFFISLHHRI
jgi:RNA polymerase sigma-70 factor (family 1)